MMGGRLSFVTVLRNGHERAEAHVLGFGGKGVKADVCSATVLGP